MKKKYNKVMKFKKTLGLSLFIPFALTILVSTSTICSSIVFNNSVANTPIDLSTYLNDLSDANLPSYEKSATSTNLGNFLESPSNVDICQRIKEIYKIGDGTTSSPKYTQFQPNEVNCVLQPGSTNIVVEAKTESLVYGSNIMLTCTINSKFQLLDDIANSSTVVATKTTTLTLPVSSEPEEEDGLLLKLVNDEFYAPPKDAHINQCMIEPGSLVNDSSTNTGQCKIIPIPDSKWYDNASTDFVILKYSYIPNKVNLATIIPSNITLDYQPNLTSEQLYSALCTQDQDVANLLIKGIDLDNIIWNATDHQNGGTMLISAVTTAPFDYYYNSKNLIFNWNSRWDVNDFIPNKYIGTFIGTPNAQDIYDYAHIANSSTGYTQDQWTLLQNQSTCTINSTNNTATITINSDSVDFLQGSITVNYDFQGGGILLIQDIPNWDLGYVVTSHSSGPSVDEIKAAIATANPSTAADIIWNDITFDVHNDIDTGYGYANLNVRDSSTRYIKASDLVVQYQLNNLIMPYSMLNIKAFNPVVDYPSYGSKAYAAKAGAAIFGIKGNAYNNYAKIVIPEYADINGTQTPITYIDNLQFVNSAAWPVNLAAFDATSATQLTEIGAIFGNATPVAAFDNMYGDGTIVNNWAGTGKNVKSILNLPDSLERIGDYAFNCLKNLKCFNGTTISSTSDEWMRVVGRRNSTTPLTHIKYVGKDIFLNSTTIAPIYNTLKSMAWNTNEILAISFGSCYSENSPSLDQPYGSWWLKNLKTTATANLNFYATQSNSIIGIAASCFEGANLTGEFTNTNCGQTAWNNVQQLRGVRYICDRAFYGTSITSFGLKLGTVTATSGAISPLAMIGNEAFANCPNFRQLSSATETVHQSLNKLAPYCTWIGDNAFVGTAATNDNTIYTYTDAADATITYSGKVFKYAAWKNDSRCTKFFTHTTHLGMNALPADINILTLSCGGQEVDVNKYAFKNIKDPMNFNILISAQCLYNSADTYLSGMTGIDDWYDYLINNETLKNAYIGNSTITADQCVHIVTSIDA